MRGKKRAGFELSFEFKWRAALEGIAVAGSAKCAANATAAALRSVMCRSYCAHSQPAACLPACMPANSAPQALLAPMQGAARGCR